MTPENIKAEIRKYVLEAIGEEEDLNIDSSTLLISDGLLDSISTLKMVDFLENSFGIEIQPHDVVKENLDSIDLITEFVLSKK